MSLRSRRAVALAFAAATALFAACSDDDADSDTPRIVVVDDSELTELLMTADDVAQITGFAGVEARELDEVPVFENPDPRGPCGSPVPNPPVDVAAGRALTGSTIGLVQFVQTASPEFEAFIDALEADQGPPCDGYSSRTNAGTVQTVTDLTVFAATGDDVTGVVWTGLVSFDGNSTYFGAMALEADGAATFVTVQSGSEIPEEGMTLLADRAVRRLRGDV